MDITNIHIHDPTNGGVDILYVKDSGALTTLIVPDVCVEFAYLLLEKWLVFTYADVQSSEFSSIAGTKIAGTNWGGGARSFAALLG